MWVNVEPTENGMVSAKMNLANAIAVEEYPDFFRLNYPSEGYYRVKKTPEMVEAYNSLVPVKSQPVVPAEPFRITGLGLYETKGGEKVRIVTYDISDDDGVPWVSEGGYWYQPDGVYFSAPPYDDRHIVKLIKLDEVQP